MTDPFTRNLREVLHAWLLKKRRKPDVLEKLLPGNVCSKKLIRSLLAGEEIVVPRKQGMAIASMLAIPADKVMVY